MATSNTGGAFGFLRKSIGGVVYSVSTSSIKGTKKQVARQKPTSVRNPKTISQIVQRMKVVPAQLFYQAFEKAAGSVENNPLSHSFQGIAYGNKNKLRFMQLAMQGDPKAYVPKGINFAVPGVYQVSEGSLPSIPWRGISEGEGTTMLPALEKGSQMTSNHVEVLTGYGVQVGDQITVLALMENGKGQYDAIIGRIIVGVNNSWDLNDDIPDVGVNNNGLVIDNDSLAAISLIVSRGTSSSTAKRSTESMYITPKFQTLLSPEAFDAAVDSYITGVAYNSLNSDWYLNQGSTQAFNGEIFTLNVPLADDANVSAPVLLGRRLNGGSLEYVVFYNQVNQGPKNPFKIEDGNIAPTITIALGTVIETMGNVSYVQQAISQALAEAYYQQMKLKG